MMIAVPKLYPTANGCIHPFWWLNGGKRTTVKADATLAVKNATHKECTFPSIYNTKDVEQGQQLVLFCPGAKNKPSEPNSSAREVVVEDDKPKKKAKQQA